MAENLGPRFFLRTADKQRGAVTAPLPLIKEEEMAPPPSQEDKKALEAGRFTPRGFTKFLFDAAKNHPVRTIGAAIALAAGGAAVVEAAQGNIPGQHESVPTNSSLNDNPEKPTTRDVFDPTAREGVIKPGMIEYLPQEDKLDPFKKIDDHNTVTTSLSFDVSTSQKPDAPIKYIRANNGSGNEQDRENRAKEGLLNMYKFDNIQPGTTIIASIDGNLLVNTSGGKSIPINDHGYSGATIDIPVKGKKFRLVMAGSTKSTDAVFQSLTNAPAVGGSPEEVKEINKRSIPIKDDTPILRVVGDEPIMLYVFLLRMVADDIDLNKMKEVIINGNKVLVPVLDYDPNDIKLELATTPDGKIILKLSPQK